MSTRQVLIVDNDANLLEMLADSIECYCEDCRRGRVGPGRC